jgi:hypothetical protein
VSACRCRLKKGQREMCANVIAFASAISSGSDLSV